MATIASLGVSLTARIGNFEKGFKKAQRTITRFGSDLARHTITIAKYGAALVSVAAGAIAYFTKQQFGAVDATMKMGRTLGLTGSELSAYEHLASLSGVATNELHQSLMRMNRSITGGGSTSERLRMVADEYAGLSDETQRAELLQRAFGIGGRRMGALLEQGAAGIERAQQEAERLGLSFDDIDGRKIEEANDAITRMRAVISGAARTLAIQLAPFIIAAADKLTDMGTQGEGMGEKVVNAFNWVLKAVARLLDYFELVKGGFYGFQAVVQGGAGAILSVINMIGQGWVELFNLVFRTNFKFTSMFEDMAKDFSDAAAESATKAAGAIGKFASGANSKKAEAVFEAIQKKAEQVAQSTSNIGAGLEDIIDTADKARRGEGRQVDLSRIVIGSQSPTDKPVNQKQGNMMVTSLAQIARNTAQPASVIS